MVSWAGLTQAVLNSGPISEEIAIHSFKKYLLGAYVPDSVWGGNETHRLLSHVAKLF